jgi:predicted phosphodiesterase
MVIRALATDLTAVYGNADGPELGLPAVAEVTLGGVTFVVTHGTHNPGRGRRVRLDRRIGANPR